MFFSSLFFAQFVYTHSLWHPQYRNFTFLSTIEITITNDAIGIKLLGIRNVLCVGSLSPALRYLAAAYTYNLNACHATTYRTEWRAAECFIWFWIFLFSISFFLFLSFGSISAFRLIRYEKRKLSVSINLKVNVFFSAGAVLNAGERERERELVSYTRSFGSIRQGTVSNLYVYCKQAACIQRHMHAVHITFGALSLCVSAQRGATGVRSYESCALSHDTQILLSWSMQLKERQE